MVCRIVLPKYGGHTPTPTHSVCRQIAVIAGGFSAYSGTGGWFNSADNYIEEEILIVDIALSADIDIADRQAQNLRKLCRDIAHNWNQDCVYFAIDGIVEYVN